MSLEIVPLMFNCYFGEQCVCSNVLSLVQRSEIELPERKQLWTGNGVCQKRNCGKSSLFDFENRSELLSFELWMTLALTKYRETPLMRHYPESVYNIDTEDKRQKPNLIKIFDKINFDSIDFSLTFTTEAQSCLYSEKGTKTCKN